MSQIKLIADMEKTGYLDSSHIRDRYLGNFEKEYFDINTNGREKKIIHLTRIILGLLIMKTEVFQRKRR